MHNNPLQEIHTDYSVNDIFKPAAANQLAKSIHYDFVITQDMFDNYVSANSEYVSSYVDMGSVISSKLDGTSQNFPAKVKAPVSIYIEANTTGYSLEFTNRLNDTGDIIDYSDVSDFTDYINVYSAHPYTVYALAGGLNFWSTPTAYAILNNPTLKWSGVCKIGCYRLDNALDMGTRPDLQLVFSYSMNGYLPKQSPTSGQCESGYTPAVVFANWMTCAGVTREYKILASDTSVPGLFQSITETYNTYGTEVVLNVSEHEATSMYYITMRSTDSLRFTNPDNGKVVVISVNGNITWKSSTGGQGGGSGTCVITDFDPIGAGCSKCGVGTYGIFTGLYSILDAGKTSIIHSGDREFKLVTEDTAGPLSGNGWTYSGTGQEWYNDFPWFRFHDDEDTLDLYFWYAFQGVDSKYESVEYYTNTHIKDKVFRVNVNELRIGVVYEIRFHCVALPSGDHTSSDAEELDWGRWISPVNGYQSLTATLAVEFSSSGFNTTTKAWGSENATGSPKIIPSFRNPSDYRALSVSPTQAQFPIISEASIQFVRLDDTVYIMRY